MPNATPLALYSVQNRAPRSSAPRASTTTSTISEIRPSSETFGVDSSTASNARPVRIGMYELSTFMETDMTTMPMTNHLKCQRWLRIQRIGPERL